MVGESKIKKYHSETNRQDSRQAKCRGASTWKQAYSCLVYVSDNEPMATRRTGMCIDHFWLDLVISPFIVHDHKVV